MRPCPAPTLLIAGLIAVAGSFAAAAAPAVQGSPEAGEPPVRLANHRAVYDLSLAQAGGGARQVDGAEGRIVIDFSGDACRGFTMQTRQVTRLTSGESGDRLSDLRNTTFESGDGHSFRFKTASVLDGRAAPAVDGSAETAPAALKVKLKEPKRDAYQSEGEVLFPVRHMQRLIQAARAGETTVSARVFDGSDDGRKVYDTLAVIGRAKAAPASAEAGATARDRPLREGDLAAMRRWPVTLSYFTTGEGERTPIYTLAFDLYENGISGGLRLDYGEFAIEGNLSRLDMAKADGKGDGKSDGKGEGACAR